jgi:hypothetical protein
MKNIFEKVRDAVIADKAARSEGNLLRFGVETKLKLGVHDNNSGEHKSVEFGIDSSAIQRGIFHLAIATKEILGSAAVRVSRVSEDVVRNVKEHNFQD